MFYCKPPLPFNGNKYMWRDIFKDVFKQVKGDYIFIDLFGGSGLLSNWIHYYKPHSKVIYNDYDNFKSRLDKIPQTNTIFAYLRKYLKNHPYATKINEEDSKHIIEYITQYKDYDEITINSALTFNGRAKLEHGLLWSKIPKKGLQVRRILRWYRYSVYGLERTL